jgi:hypothetical protein
VAYDNPSLFFLAPPRERIRAEGESPFLFFESFPNPDARSTRLVLEKHG